ncbi:MAG: phosphoribosylanthranilate isomerase [Pseudomonadota bacterium]
MSSAQTRAHSSASSSPVTDVKICGLSTAATMDAALDAGAAYVGLVFFSPSPRDVSVADAAPLARRAAGRAKTVALFVDPSDDLVDAVARDVRPDYVQLHGDESADRAGAIATRAEAKLIKAIKVATREDLAAAAEFEGLADILLFDAKPPKVPADGAAALPGGNGDAFDWRILEAAPQTSSWMLSGGLRAENVADAIAATSAPALDVSSGVERARGEKDVDLIHQFMTAVRLADQAVAAKPLAEPRHVQA